MISSCIKIVEEIFTQKSQEACKVEKGFSL